ncbi:hypothetical protein N7476_005033 [Penicillium atrosanguineum]|uniref:DUF221-domain-containing protein n=1 Tax=Penicillium atrosanguineum TaxID=1132637 RepID=A0A9W9U586_9EURO|nr:hypothetical protein N7476_005033 [Penicillium atrosanguineum]
MLLKIFMPLGCLVLPVLLPINYMSGKSKPLKDGISSNIRWNVTGLDQLAWGNVKPEHSSRYWAHLIMAVIVVIYVCFIIFDELRTYVRIRQDHLTSPQHQCCASANTVLVTAIPFNVLSEQALKEVFDVFPGGVRKVWINRDMGALAGKVKMRKNIARMLEKAETELIAKCNKMAGKHAIDKDQSAVRGASVGRRVYNAMMTPIPPRKPSALHKDIASSERLEVGSATIHKPVPKSGKIKKIPDQDAGHDAIFAKSDPSCPDDISDHSGEQPLWRRYLAHNDRPNMRLRVFGWDWMPRFGQKVDTIEHCRRELSQLNRDIEIDQRNPQRFPLMNSAFVQFNLQAAAHMACQSVIHPIPKQMAPRIVEVCPHDIIWSNMSIKWWERYVRTFGIITLICVMTISWAIPVAFTGLLSQLSYIQGTFTWLSWIGMLPKSVLSAMQGVLPALCMAILMALLPVCLRLLSWAQGLQTGKEIGLAVQNYYFAFLFVQLFLVVAVAASFSTIMDNITEVISWPELLAQNIPKSSNYFFSYMILQAMSVSAGALVQIAELVNWFFLAPIMDFTAREKWARMTNLNEINWDTFFPVYTTLASIGWSPTSPGSIAANQKSQGIIYSIVAPVIIVFNITTFTLFWIVYRYNTLYVTGFRIDTGGLLFPRAINQLFVDKHGLSFFLVRDEKNAVACQIQGVCMILLLLFTIGYQSLLNEAFEPLINYLPVMKGSVASHGDGLFRCDEFSRINARRHPKPRDTTCVDPRDTMFEEPVEQIFVSGTSGRIPLSACHAHNLGYKDPSKKGDGSSKEVATRDSKPSQVGQAPFFGAYGDVKENNCQNSCLTPHDFQHEALRDKRPVIWIPCDHLGVSEDEIHRTRRLSKHIWITNRDQSLDGKCRTVFSQAPPEFPEWIDP